ncbi:MAG: cupin domain-containing protein, partial [Saprospiraceae bacterium]|nr:cupin domain-containing protein [Saprospiraceae bacterium]
VGLNRQIVSLWKNYTESTWKTPIVLPDSSEADLAFLVKDYVDHLEHHLKQIFTTPYDISIPKSTSEKISSENQQILQILLREGNVSVEFYQPKDKDSQQPHLQDEFYFIANGNADFDRDGSIEKVKAGDFLFVPAGEKHHFLNFSSGFSTWVVFF